MAIYLCRRESQLPFESSFFPFITYSCFWKLDPQLGTIMSSSFYISMVILTRSRPLNVGKSDRYHFQIWILSHCAPESLSSILFSPTLFHQVLLSLISWKSGQWRNKDLHSSENYPSDKIPCKTILPCLYLHISEKHSFLLADWRKLKSVIIFLLVRL